MSLTAIIKANHLLYLVGPYYAGPFYAGPYSAKSKFRPIPPFKAAFNATLGKNQKKGKVFNLQ